MIERGKQRESRPRHRALATVDLAVKNLFFIIVALGLSVPAPAGALPGQRTADFLAWLKSNAALAGYSLRKDELSGTIAYQKIISDGQRSYIFSAEPGVGGRVHDETLVLQFTPPDVRFDISRRLGDVTRMLANVYGNAVALDFAHAKVLGSIGVFRAAQKKEFLRGKLYGYQLFATGVTVSPRDELVKDMQIAKICATQECGD